MLQKERNSSFELLRLISMLLIVMHHYSLHGGFDYMSTLSLRLYFIQCLNMGGKLGVNLFILISGYFLCKSNFKWQRIIKLELEVIFYSLVIGIIFLILFPEGKSFNNLLREIMPLLSGRYWFYNTYFVLILLSPFINKLIVALSKDEFKKLLLIFFVLWVLIPFVHGLKAIEMSNLGWFIFLYLIAAYIRFFKEDFTKKTTTFYISLGIRTYILILLSVLVFDLLGLLDSRFQKYFDYFLKMNSILVFACSILLLIGFSKWNINYKRSINILASTTFGIYLIHDNKLVRPFLWKELLENATYFDSNKIFLHAFLSILSVYICCIVIDLMRQFIFEKPLFSIVDKIRKRGNL